MKNTRFLKLATLVLVCVLSVCAFVGIIASAEDAVPTAEIESANVAYNDMVQLAFTVTSANLPDGAALGIMTWKADAVEFTAENAAYSTFESSEKDGVKYYKTLGIPAPEMDTPIYVAAVYKVGNDVTVAETPFKYSALQYAGTRLTESDVSAKQATVYENLIEYGISSDTVFEGDEDYAFVKAVNGTIGSAGAKIGGWMGKEVLLRAEAKNGDGEYFIEWQNAAGESISNKRLAYVTVESAGITEYTAVFGERTESPYANTYNFEYLTTGQLTKTPTGMTSLNNFGAYNSYYITENNSGDKQLFIDRLQGGGGSYGVSVPIGSTEQITAIEYDIEFNEAVKAGVFNNTNFTIKNSAGKTAIVRMNFQYTGNDKFYLYMEGNKFQPLKVDGAIKYFNSAVGSTFTLRMELDLDSIRAVEIDAQKHDEAGKPIYVMDEAGNYLDKNGNIATKRSQYVAVTEKCTSYTADLLFYINGEYIGKIDMMDCQKTSEDKGYFGDYSNARKLNYDGTIGFIIDKDTTITGSFGISSLSAAESDISLDNFMYYAAE